MSDIVYIYKDRNGDLWRAEENPEPWFLAGIAYVYRIPYDKRVHIAQQDEPRYVYLPDLGYEVEY